MPAGAGVERRGHAAGPRGWGWSWAPVIAYMGVIFYLSSQSRLPIGPGVSDTLLHALAYAGLAVVFVNAFCGGLPARVTPLTAVLTWVLAVGYGATDEFHQMFVPNRTAALDDLAADALGALVGVTLCWAWGKLSA